MEEYSENVKTVEEKKTRQGGNKRGKRKKNHKALNIRRQENLNQATELFSSQAASRLC